MNSSSHCRSEPVGAGHRRVLPLDAAVDYRYYGARDCSYADRQAAGAPALGDGGRIVVAVKDNTVATIVSINPDGSDPKKLTDSKTFDGCPRSRARQSHRVLQGAGAFL